MQTGIVEMPRSRRISQEAEELTTQAHLRWDAGELVAAFRSMLRAARAGDSSAMLNVGYMYDCGIGTQKNRTKAMEWYKKAFRRGVAAAAGNIGTIYRSEGNTKEALAWFQRAVKLGDIQENLEIARLYLRNPASFADAIPYLKIVADADATMNISSFGKEEAQRLLERLEWTPVSRNASSLRLKADELIAKAERERQGGSLRLALRAYHAAAKLGDSYAEFYLGEAYFDWTGVRQDWVKALHWFKQAYKHGVKTADFNIGCILREENPKQALIWFKRAHDRGDYVASVEIAKIYNFKMHNRARAICYLESVANSKETEVPDWRRAKARTLLETLGSKPAGKSTPISSAA